MTNEETVRSFIAAWSRLDVDELVSYFTEEGVYHNMPIEPVSGHEALKQFIARFLSDWEQTDWEVINLQSSDDTVFVERVDRTVVSGKPVNLPCVGVFEMEEGKIRVWRDYFDMSTYTRALA